MRPHSIYEISTGRIVSWGNGVPTPEDGQDVIEGIYEGDYYKVVNGVAVSTGEPKTPITKVRSQAKADFVSYLEWKANEVSGLVPTAERSTWDRKEDAALAYKAGVATPKQLSLLNIEASLVGETVATTANKIVANSTMFYIAGPLITGLRRKVFKVIDTAVDEVAVEDALDLGYSIYEQVMANPVAFSQDPSSFLEGLR